jgi:hypothetical protein
MIQEGRLSAAIIGRNRYRIPKDALDALLQPKEAEPTCDGISQDPLLLLDIACIMEATIFAYRDLPRYHRESQVTINGGA